MKSVHLLALSLLFLSLSRIIFFLILRSGCYITKREQDPNLDEEIEGEELI